MSILKSTLLLLSLLTFKHSLSANTFDLDTLNKYMFDFVDGNPLSLNEKNRLIISNVNSKNYSSDGNRLYYQGVRGQTESTPLYTFRTADPNSYMDKTHNPISISKLSRKASFEMTTVEFDKNSEKIVAFQECWENGPSEYTGKHPTPEHTTVPVQCVMADYEICRLSNTIGNEFWEKGYRTILKTKAKEMADRLARETPPRNITTKEGDEKIMSGVESHSFYLQNYRPNFTAREDSKSIYDDVSSTALMKMKAFCAKLPFNSDKELANPEKKHSSTDT